MKSTLAVCIGLFLVMDGAAEVPVNIGDTRDVVYQELGKPRSYLQYDETELLYYDRGKLELEKGVVTLVDIMDDETFEAYRAEMEEHARIQQILAQQRAAERIAVGSVLRDKKLEDPVFMSSSSSQRVAYWSAFKKKYPEVDIHDVYTEALAEREVELREEAAIAAREKQIADLEQRVVEAERRAEQAEAASRVERYYVGSHLVYPSRTVYYPSRYTYTSCSPSYKISNRTHHRHIVGNHHTYSGYRSVSRGTSYGYSSCSPSSYARVHINF